MRHQEIVAELKEIAGLMVTKRWTAAERWERLLRRMNRRQVAELRETLAEIISDAQAARADNQAAKEGAMTPVYAVRFADAGDYLGRRTLVSPLEPVEFAHACTSTDRVKIEQLASSTGLPDAEVVVLEKNSRGQYDPRLSHRPVTGAAMQAGAARTLREGLKVFHGRR